MTPVSAVYGPVSSWRFGQSLGIDLIGAVSTCSFNCRYCQLGTIEQITAERRHFVPTLKIRAELEQTLWADVDVVTLSGSGEPTLALNLGEVIQVIQTVTSLPVVVLTNGTLLGDRAVQQDLSTAAKVAIKLDAVSSEYWRTLNRPVAGLSLEALLEGIIAFRQRYAGHLAIQTMVMEPWSKSEERRYVALLEAIQPDEVQLNTPLRSRPIDHQIEARSNTPDPAWRHPQHVTLETLAVMGARLQAALTIPVRYPLSH
ncbi:MAG: radical SAM protein [Cyanobacteria bacterium J06638_28]